jgi:NitT/TauT family transport system substrate-binding protein
MGRGENLPLAVSRRRLPVLCRCAVLLAVSLMGSVGCSPRVAEPIRIGVNLWPGYELFHVAAKMGYFEEEGVDVQILEFVSLADCRRALERGQLDGAATTLVELIEARGNGRDDLRIIMVVDFSNGGDVVLGQPSLEGLADIEGKQVALELGSLGIYVLARALESVGLGLSDVQLVSTDQLSGAAAFESGDVDAFVTYPPISDRVRATMRSGVLFDSSQIPGEVLDVLVMDQRVILRRGDDVRRVLRAYDRAAAFVRAHPAEAYGIMAEREAISVEEFRRSFEEDIQMVYRDEHETLFEAGGAVETALRRTAAFLEETGQIDGPVTVTDLLLSAEQMRVLDPR